MNNNARCGTLCVCPVVCVRMCVEMKGHATGTVAGMENFLYMGFSFACLLLLLYHVHLLS